MALGKVTAAGAPRSGMPVVASPRARRRAKLVHFVRCGLVYHPGDPQERPNPATFAGTGIGLHALFFAAPG